MYCLGGDYYRFCGVDGEIMSNSMTNVEVEDVLNSIRRLVSEDSTLAETHSPTEFGRLVLTPALRVAESADDSDAQGAPDLPTPDIQAPDLLTLSQDDLIDAQPDQPWDSAADVHDQAPDPDPVREQDQVSETEIADAHDTADGLEFQPVADDSDENPEQKFDTDIDDPDVETAGRTAPDHNVVADDDVISRQPDEEDRETSTDHASAAGAGTDVGEHPSNERSGLLFSHQTANLNDRFAKLEQAVNQTQEDWEPDGSEPDAADLPRRHIFETTRFESRRSDQASLAQDTGDIGAPDVSAPESDPVSPVDQPDFAADMVETQTPDRDETPHDADELVIDDVALSEMVAEIVRRELQGSLGERITRNVRRMVKREVQKALTLKDFE